MKKVIFILAAVFTLSLSAVSAQNYMVVDSEKVFKSMASYNSAVTQIEADAATYQKQVDDQFAAIERSFNDYQARKASMTAAQRQAAEQGIVANEEKANKFQEDTFGEEGTLAKKRESLLKPIQDRVTTIIQTYARSNNFSLVLDIASNPSVLYYNTSIDRTNQIINLVK